MIYLKKLIFIILLIFGLVAIDAFVEGLGTLLIICVVGLIIGIPFYKFVSTNSTLSQKQVDCDTADLITTATCECGEIVGDGAIDGVVDFICGMCD